MSPFASFLRQIRASRGYLQKEFAHHLGYEASYVSALERSRKGPPRRDFVDRVIRLLRLTDEEQVELQRALQASKRQIVLPCAASEDEYRLLRDLEPQLGHLRPIQIELIRLALSLPAHGG